MNVNALPNISGRECAQVLQKIEFYMAAHKGDHLVLYRANPPSQVTIPDHDELDRMTLAALLRLIGLQLDEFLWLLKASA